MKITTVFKNESDAPINDLVPLITITDITDILNPVVIKSNQNMVGLTNGFYAYIFETYVQGKEYTVYIDANAIIENRYQYGVLEKIDQFDFLNTLDTDIESGIGIKELLRLFTAVLTNRSSGGGTDTITFRDYANSKDRIVATVDENGNRLNVILDSDR